jgi:hypothetical protein
MLEFAQVDLKQLSADQSDADPIVRDMAREDLAKYAELHKAIGRVLEKHQAAAMREQGHRIA